jgi:hypothetical protein
MKTLFFRRGVAYVASVLLMVTVCSCFQMPTVQQLQAKKVSPYEQIDFEGVLKRYLGKDFKPAAPIEGIYEVSCTITKKGRGFLSSTVREKSVKKKENYAKVAIMKDWPESNREYLEISLYARSVPHYPIVGDFQSFSEGGGFVYKHYVPNGKPRSFTFTQDLQPEILEGVYSEVKGSQTITYKLTYLKVYPKRSDATAVKKSKQE